MLEVFALEVSNSFIASWQSSLSPGLQSQLLRLWDLIVLIPGLDLFLLMTRTLAGEITFVRPGLFFSRLLYLRLTATLIIWGSTSLENFYLSPKHLFSSADSSTLFLQKFFNSGVLQLSSPSLGLLEILQTLVKMKHLIMSSLIFFFPTILTPPLIIAHLHLLAPFLLLGGASRFWFSPTVLFSLVFSQQASFFQFAESLLGWLCSLLRLSLFFCRGLLLFFFFAAGFFSFLALNVTKYFVPFGFSKRPSQASWSSEVEEAVRKSCNSCFICHF